jgi:hypothetical protein
MPLVIDNFFNLLFFFALDQVWWGSGEVWSMVSHFLVQGEERSMKYVINSPVVWQSEPIGYQGDHF